MQKELEEEEEEEEEEEKKKAWQKGSGGDASLTLGEKISPPPPQRGKQKVNALHAAPLT